MVGYKNLIAKNKTQLLKTTYYDKLNDEEYKQLNSKRRQRGKNKTNN